MYERYIPPPKGQATTPKEPAVAPEPTPEPAPAQVPASTAAADGYSYSRYIPGAKAPSKPLPVAKELQRFEDEPSSPKAKRKRDAPEEVTETQQPEPRKPKKAKKDGKSEAVSAGNDREAMQEEGEFETEVVYKKEKKDKKKKEKKERKGPESPQETNKSTTGEIPRTTPDAPESLDHSMDDVDVQQIQESERKRKKEKKGKKHRQKGMEQEDAESEAADNVPEDVSMDDASDPDPAVRKVPQVDQADLGEEKKKRKKSKKSQDVSMSEDEGHEESKEDRRHKTVLERKTKSLKIASELAQNAQEPESPVEETELHGLEPLPQPEPVAPDGSKPTYDTLPSWLAAPIRVPQDTKVPFSELGLLPKAARVLEEKGYAEAFAVQTAALPLLLPTSKHRTGDLLISAATGSGKTLAYALPVVRDLSQGVVTRLRALVVLPTRELVKQAQEVFELCAKAFEGGDRKRVRIGISIGSQALRYEQDTLMDKATRYDLAEYEKILNQRRVFAPGSDADASVLDDMTAQDADPRLGKWRGEVVDYMSKVDVLICTPGRLVEHMEQTRGFSFDYVRWLVVDEADKLLAQSFQGWLELVMDKFRVNDVFGARDFPDIDFSGVRKVVLSATLTRDLSLLNQLALRRPQLIVLEREGDSHVAEHTLPASLKEYAVRVHDANLKPLYLLELLRSPHMASGPAEVDSGEPAADGVSSDSDTSSSSDSSSSESDSSSDSGSETSDSESDAKPSPRATTQQTKASSIPVALIFTKSNESALRLSRLLTLLDESLGVHISTLTSTTPTHIRRKTLRAFTTPSSPVRLIVASDLVARGIDLPKLDHVVNYDLPPSVAGYVHRVGRTARAGRSGSAWTLVADDESGWFWGKIAKGSGVRRALKVERTRIEEMDEERVERYEAALEKLGKEAVELRRR
ncbi:hypothetical protein S7711_05089 [Stachybotrys chartarum IBT 7711]|uniref:ATP-dependent RNA helicase n=1 Tax=Stachybotrys chartarum (strain CBS 109288 / IBT 7711) TaxID=1280523 RepID=A0A084ANU0_STACB|nr:hypothetical protein S7711_05089 [Stachybotrys chartarum IBT 7711]